MSEQKYFERAQHLLSIQSFANAEREIKEGLALDPDNVDLISLLVLALCELNRSREALPAAKRVLELAPDNSSAHRVLAKAYFECRQYVEAEHHIRESIQLDATSYTGFLLFAEILYAQNKLEEALIYAHKGCELNPSNSTCHNTVAHLLLMLHRLDEAERAIETGLQLDPQSAWAHLNMGLLALVKAVVKGEPPEDSEHLLNALRIRPNDASIQFFIGVSLVQSNDYAGGEKFLRESIRIYPESSKSYVWLTRSLIGQQRLEEAIESGRTAVMLSPLANSYRALAEALFIAGKAAEAEEPARMMLELCPDDPIYHVLMLQILVDLKQFVEAIDHGYMAIKLSEEDSFERQIAIDALIKAHAADVAAEKQKAQPGERKQKRGFFRFFGR